MKKKGIMFVFGAGFLLIIIYVIMHFKLVKQLELHRLTERLNFVGNTLTVEIDRNCGSIDFSCYWVGFLSNSKAKDTIEIYYNGKKNNIPDAYGENQIIVKFKKEKYDKIGIWKFKEWYKHNYYINLKKLDSLLIIGWSISNKYDMEVKYDTLRMDSNQADTRL